MRVLLFSLAILVFLSDAALACSYCRSKTPASGSGPAPTSTTSGGGGGLVMRGAAPPKSAIDLNSEEFWRKKKVEEDVSERGSFEMVIQGGYQ